MSETTLDLAYRGISLGKRIKLGQVRPATGFLEMAAPMPVGTRLALATDEGVAIDATVTWVHEQVTGADRPAGMIVAPALADPAAAAWWKARVELPEEEAPRRLTRTRPVTLRPRSQTLQTPPPEGATAEAPPSLAADLAARVAAAAGVAAPAQPTAPSDSNMRQTGEHQVVDDGNRTVIMQAIDPATLDLGPPTEAETAVPGAIGDPSDTAAMEVTIDTSGDTGGDTSAGDGDDEPDGGEAAPAAESNTGAGNGKRRRKRKR